MYSTLMKIVKRVLLSSRIYPSPRAPSGVDGAYRLVETVREGDESDDVYWTVELQTSDALGKEQWTRVWGAWIDVDSVQLPVVLVAMILDAVGQRREPCVLAEYAQSRLVAVPDRTSSRGVSLVIEARLEDALGEATWSREVTINPHDDSRDASQKTMAVLRHFLSLRAAE